MQKSLARSEKSDPDYVLEDDETGNLRIEVENMYDFKNDKVFLVYESKLKELFHLCQSCGGFIDDIKTKKGDGTQHRVELSCINGCVKRWSTQPTLDTVSGKHFNTRRMKDIPKPDTEFNYYFGLKSIFFFGQFFYKL